MNRDDRALLENKTRNLVVEIENLKANLQTLKEYKEEIFIKLSLIRRGLHYIMNKQIMNDKKVQSTLSRLDNYTNEIINLLEDSPREGKKNFIYYKVKLRKVLDFGILDVTSDTISISITFKGVLFKILEVLIEKYIADCKSSIAFEYRGYISRKELEQKIYGKYVGRGRLNSHLTRIRKILMDNGFTEKIITSLDSYVRLNIIGNDVSLTTSVRK